MHVLVTKIALRILARRNPEKRADIREILRDPDKLSLVSLEVENTARMVYGFGEGAGLLDFLNWIIEHADEIFAIISKLLIIFAEEENE